MPQGLGLDAPPHLVEGAVGHPGHMEGIGHAPGMGEMRVQSTAIGVGQVERHDPDTLEPVLGVPGTPSAQLGGAFTLEEVGHDASVQIDQGGGVDGRMLGGGRKDRNESPWVSWRLQTLGKLEPWKPRTSSRRYPPEMKERAVRMVEQTIAESGERWGVVSRIARQLGIGEQTLRNWVEQAEIDLGNRPGVSTDDKARIAELEKEVRELRRANAILKSASAFFAAKLDRPKP